MLFGEIPKIPKECASLYLQRFYQELEGLALNYKGACLASKPPSRSSDVLAFSQLGDFAGKLQGWQWAQCRLPQSWQGLG